MAKISRLAGSTGHILTLFVQDSSQTDGSGLTGLTNASAGLTCYYKRNTGSASAAVTLDTIVTLGTYGTYAAGHGGFKEIDATNLPGFYEFQPPDAALASGAKSVAFLLKGATNMVPCPVEIELTATDNQTAGGASNLGANPPANWLDAAAIAAGALNGKGDWLTTLGTNAPAGWLDIDAFAIDAWQVQTRRIDVTGTTTPATADTYISYGYHNDRTYFKSTTLGTTIYLWYDAVGTQWVLSEAVGTNGTAYFISTGTTFFDGNFIAQGTATGTPVAAAHGGSMLSAHQYPTTFESLTIQGAATFSGGVTVNPTTLNTAAVQLTGNGAGPGLKITGGNVAAPAIQLITQSGTNADTILLSPDGTGKDINSKFFNGITSLSQWLGLLAGKQAGDTTALTEIKATGAGAGTYDPTADSLQALRVQGDAAWTTATSVTVTGTVVLDASQPNYAPAKAGDAMALTTSERTSLAGVVWSTDVSTGYTGGEAGAKLNAAGAAGDPWATDISTGYTGNQAGAKLNSAASAGDPWSTDLPGAYVAGQAGYIVGHYIDAAISSAVDKYIKARIYGAVTANADGSLDFKDVVDGTTVRVRIGPTSPVGGRTVTTFP